MTRLENNVRKAAEHLGNLETEKYQEYVRLVAAGDVKSFDAWALVEAQYALVIRQAQAEYDIAVADLRREQCH